MHYKNFLTAFFSISFLLSTLSLEVFAMEKDERAEARVARGTAAKPYTDQDIATAMQVCRVALEAVLQEVPFIYELYQRSLRGQPYDRETLLDGMSRVFKSNTYITFQRDFYLLALNENTMDTMVALAGVSQVDDTAVYLLEHVHQVTTLTRVFSEKLEWREYNRGDILKTIFAHAFRQLQAQHSHVPPAPVAEPVFLAVPKPPAAVAEREPVRDIPPVVAKAAVEPVAPPMKWEDVMPPVKEVLFSVGDTQTQVLRWLRTAHQGLENLTEAEHLQNPADLLALLEARQKHLEESLEHAPRLRGAVQHLHIDRFTALKRRVEGVLLPCWDSAFKKLFPAHDLAEAIIELKGRFPVCGPMPEETVRSAAYQAFVREFDPLKDAYALLLREDNVFFLNRERNLDIWGLRKLVVPNLLVPGEKEPEAVTVAAQPVAPPKITAAQILHPSIVTGQNRLNDEVVTLMAGARGDEGIMAIADAKRAPSFLLRVSRILPHLVGYHKIDRSPISISQQELWEFYQELLPKVPAIAHPGFNIGRIRDTFRNLTENYDGNFRELHPIARPVSSVYLEAFTLLKDVVKKFSTEDEGIKLLVTQMFSDFDLQGTKCGGGALGRSIIGYNAILHFLMNR